jgi:hypothetical protein
MCELPPLEKALEAGAVVAGVALLLVAEGVFIWKK